MALSNLADLRSPLRGAVQLLLNVLVAIERSWLARQLQALVKIWQVEFEDEHRVGQVVGLAQLFELFG